MVNYGMSLELVQTMSLEQRLETTQEIQQIMAQQQRQELSMQQYQVRTEPFDNLYEWALKNPQTHKMFNSFGINFTYFEVPKKKAESFGIRGNSPGHFVVLDNCIPVKFVISGILPNWTSPYIALHEHGEHLSNFDHFWASRLEFAAVAKGIGKKSQGTSYIDAINRTFPAKFVDLLVSPEYVFSSSVEQSLREHETGQMSKEREIAQKMIDNYHFSPRVLSLANEYKNMNESVERAVTKGIEDANNMINNPENNFEVGEMEAWANKYMIDACRYISYKHGEVLREYTLDKLKQLFDASIRENFITLHGTLGYKIKLVDDSMKSAINEAISRRKSIIITDTNKR